MSSKACASRAPNARRGSTRKCGGTEDLEDRLLEVTNELVRHERRDDRLEYSAYVPPGSISRGKRLVVTGDGGKTQPCSTCHLANLKGTDKIPPIAGRPPTYLLRQMLAFRNGTRATTLRSRWCRCVEKLTLNDMIDLVAYLGSLYPPHSLRGLRRREAGASRHRRAHTSRLSMSPSVPRSRLPASS